MYSEESAQKVCELVADGESLRQACADVGVKAPTFLLWVSQRSELAEQYARAKATGIDIEFERLADIQAERPERGPTGAVDSGWVAWKRLQVDTKKWELSKKAPKKYGDKTETTHELGESVREIVRTIVRAP